MNRLTLVLARLAAAPIVALLILWGDDAFLVESSPIVRWTYAGALIVFLAAAAADLFDKKADGPDLPGALHRAAGLALTACALLALCKTSLTFDSTIAAVLIIARDVAVGGLREGLIQSGRPLPLVEGAFLQPYAVYLGIGCALTAQMLIYFTPSAEVVVWLRMIAHGAIWAGAALALITGWLCARAVFAKPPAA